MLVMVSEPVNDRREATMPERDTYIPGVPCWIDTSQPDPEAAVDFYSGLFGWEFEDVMPPGLRASTSSPACAEAPSPPSDRSPSRRRPRRCGTRTSGSTAPTRPRPRCALPAVSVVKEPFDVPGAGRTAVFTDTDGAAFCVWQAYQHKGAQVVNEPGSLNFNDLSHPRRGGCEVVLRRRVRLGDARAGWRVRDVDAARLRRLPRARRPRHPQARGRARRRAGIRGRRGEHQPDRGRPARRSAALGGDLRGSGRRRHRREGRRARRHGRRRAVRCPVGRV